VTNASHNRARGEPVVRRPRRRTGPPSTEGRFHPLPASRKEARRIGADRFFTGIPCKHGHVAPRYTSTKNCVACQVEHARRRGGWRARPSKNDFLRLAREIVERRGGTLLSKEYRNAKSKLSARCGRGHEFIIAYDHLRGGQWCGKCKGQDSSDRQIKQRGHSIAELKEFARREHGGDCLATSPVGSRTKVYWKCSHADHEPFSAAISNVTNNQQWCPLCWAERRRPPIPPIPRERVEALVAARGGHIVEIMGRWAGLRTRLRVRCAYGHEWSVIARNLVHAGSWCQNCRGGYGEQLVRAIFETTFGVKFPRARPSWMRSKKGRALELDGYNEEVRLAFEYQGPHHLTDTAVKQRDAIKRNFCRRRGVRLVEVNAVKRPFPPENVLAKVAEAFQQLGLARTPILRSGDIFSASRRLSSMEAPLPRQSRLG
jgi:hypothetical protein